MSQRSPLDILWIRGFITWLSYALTGLLAVSLSAPSEHVSPLYLPAGVALALLVGWGTGCHGVGDRRTLCSPSPAWK